MKEAHFGKLRVHGGAIGLTRSSAFATLERADLKPRGMPPSAILLVHRLSVRVPRRFGARPGGGDDRSWQAARERLSELYRRAARPAHAFVPSSADAVVFADESELLASLALDLVTGRAPQRWWWIRLLGSNAFGRSFNLASALAHQAVWCPAALDLLARQGQAAAVVSEMSAAEALAVLHAVIRSYALSALAELLKGSGAGTAPAAFDRFGSSAAAAGGSQDGLAAPSRGSRGTSSAGRVALDAPSPRLPWSALLPAGAVPHGLAPAHACLLGVALSLVHRAEVVRGLRFAASLKRWWQGSNTAAMSQALQVRPNCPSSDVAARSPPARSLRPQLCEPPQAQDENSSQGSPAFAAQSPPALPAARIGIRSPIVQSESVRAEIRRRPTPAHSRSEPHPTRLGARADPDAGPSCVSLESPVAAADARDPLGAAQILSGETARAPDPTGIAAHARTRPPAFPDALDDIGGSSQGVETRLGGVFFLINLMCALNLPACFESEWSLESGAGSWELLEAIARAVLCGGNRAGSEDDPIWSTLAHLSARGDSRALGAGLRRDATFRLPSSWMVHAPPDASVGPVWATRGRVLRLWSRHGFMLSEIRVDTCEAEARAREEAARWGSIETLTRRDPGNAPFAVLLGPLARGLDRKLKRWLALVIPFIRLRLARSVGLAADDPGLPQVLFAYRGRLCVTATHLDLVMSLDQVSLPLRIAGLDRSPGWLPQFGRVIQFHFE